MTNIIFAMEMQEVRRRVYNNLIQFYDEDTARNTANSFVRVTAYCNGRPSQVRNRHGQTAYILYAD